MTAVRLPRVRRSEISSGARTGGQRTAAFSLVELLVVVGIVALLLAILLPSLQTARLRARVVRVHADLRQICVALESYALSNADAFPPTRSACGSDVEHQLPVELADEQYFPPSPDLVPQAYFVDLFNPQQTYKYTAPGALYYNRQFFDFPDKRYKPRSRVWVPEDFPRCQSEDGQFFGDFVDEPASPVRFAVWSMGPDAVSPRLPRVPGVEKIDEARLPLPRAYWLADGQRDGLITHFRSTDGFTHASP